MNAEEAAYEVKRLRLQPGDILVVHTPLLYKQEHYDNVRRVFEEALSFSGLTNSIVLMPEPYTLEILSGAGNRERLMPQPGLTVNCNCGRIYAPIESELPQCIHCPCGNVFNFGPTADQPVSVERKR